MKESWFSKIEKLFMALTLLAFFASVYFVPAIWAAPSISSVSGTISDGQTITVGGSGFGDNGPTIKVFDDFEKGTNGSKISTSLGSAQINQWDYVQGGSTEITYSTGYAHGGTKSLRVDANYAGSMPCIESQINVGPGQEIFFSWWQYLPMDKDVSGTNGPEDGGPNWKLFWLFNSPPWVHSDYVNVILSNSLPSPYTQLCVADDPNAGNLWRGSGEYADIFRKGVWTRYWLYWKGGTSSNGAAGAWQTNSVSGSKTIANVSNITNQSTGYPWNKLHFPGFERKDTNSIMYYDDIYVATGLYARARVEIGNASSYTSCTNIAILTPTSWIDTAITATVRQGSFPNGSSAFLFVLDANGTVNSKGYPITIGGPPAPAPPTGLRIVN